MRCVLALFWVTIASIGCGRLNFGTDDPTPSDGATDAPDVVAITDPAELAEVGASINLRGTCTGGTVVVSGNDISGAPTAQCTSGTFAVIVALAEGFGDKQVTVTQGAASDSRTFFRVPQIPLPLTAKSGTTTSAGSATPCDLVIDRPSGLSPGQFLIGVIHTDGGSDGSIEVGGFTRLNLNTATAVGFFKVIGFTEPAQYRFTIDPGSGVTDTCASGGVLVGFDNVDPASPILSDSSLATVDDVIVAPSASSTFTTTLVGLFGSNGPLGGITAPASMVVNLTPAPNGSFAISSDGTGNALIAWETVSEGATGSRTATVPSPAPVAGGLVVLRPH